MNQNQEIDPLLSRRQVEAALAVKATTIYKLCRAGRLAKPVRLPGLAAVRWRAADVREYLAKAQEVELRALTGGAA